MTASGEPTRKVRSQSELARHLGLSDWTVSRAINGHPAVKESTRRRVLEAMSELGFQSDPMARGLRGKRTGLIGISFNELCNSILLEKLASFEDFLRENGLRSLLAFTAQDEATELRVIADFRRMRVDAMVLLQSILSPAKSARVLAGVKSVHVDPMHLQKSSMAIVDRNRGVELLVDHLVELGHRRFGTIGILEHNAWRQPGLLKALRRHGLDPRRHLKQYPPQEDNNLSYPMGTHGAQQVVADPDRPSALIAINDRVALAAAQYLTAHGIDVPGDCSVTGFDHLEIARHLHPTLTTIDHQPQRLMEAAGHLLLEQLKDDATGRRAKSRLIPPVLVVGESTGPYRGR